MPVTLVEGSFANTEASAWSDLLWLILRSKIQMNTNSAIAVMSKRNVDFEFISTPSPQPDNAADRQHGCRRAKHKNPAQRTHLRLGDAQCVLLDRARRDIRK